MSKQPTQDEAVIYPQLLGDLLEAVPPQTPPPGLRAKILARALGSRVLADFITVRNDASWRELFPGLEFKMLMFDAPSSTKSFLLRAAPGIRLPAHGHSTLEECLVLQGEFSMGDLHLRAGDFHCAAAGVVHDEAYTANGVMVYIRSGTDDYPGINP